MEAMPRTFQVRILIVVVTFAVAGCAPAGEGPSAVGTGAPVIVPDGPGSSGRTATPGERIGSTPGVSAADVRFAEGMIPHHRQALEMAGLVRERTNSRGVRAVADQIVLTQQPEIDAMTAWLRGVGREVPGGHHGGSGAYGMASLEQLNELRAARGAAFERLFLTLMIRHHEGAVKMAGEELTAGRDRRMLLMARDVSSGQTVEIARMRTLL